MAASRDCRARVVGVAGGGADSTPAGRGSAIAAPVVARCLPQQNQAARFGGRWRGLLWKESATYTRTDHDAVTGRTPWSLRPPALTRLSHGHR